MDDKALNEMRADIKEIKENLNRFDISLAHITAKMPTQNQVQRLEMDVNTLKAQFKIVWVALGGIATLVTAIIVSSVMNLVVPS